MDIGLAVTGGIAPGLDNYRGLERLGAFDVQVSPGHGLGQDGKQVPVLLQHNRLFPARKFSFGFFGDKAEIILA